MFNKSSHSLEVVLGEPLDVVVSSEVHEVGLETFVWAILPKSVGVADVYDFVSLAVHDVHWAVKILDPINIWELVKPERPSQV